MRTQRPEPVGLHRPSPSCAGRSGSGPRKCCRISCVGLEVELPAAQEVDVAARRAAHRRAAGLSASQLHAGSAAGQMLGAPLIVDGSAARRAARGTAPRSAPRPARCACSVRRNSRARVARSAPTFMIGTISQSSGSAASRPLERVRDAAPFLHRAPRAIAAVDHVPHEGSDHADALACAAAPRRGRRARAAARITRHPCAAA